MKLSTVSKKLRNAEVIPSRKRACVAMLLRVSDRSLEKYSECLDGDGDELMKKVLLQDTQVFYILRANNENDRWGGHVGFPGGKQDNAETDRETAAREVFEEVGLAIEGLNALQFPDVDTSAFKFVGRINDRKVLSGKNGLVVCAFVFIQTTSETPPLYLQESEIAACGWVEMAQLLEDKCAVPMKYDLGKGPLKKESPTIYAITKFLQLNVMIFSKIDLRVHPLFIAGNIEEGTGRLYSVEERRPESVLERSVREAFFLWGMTFGITNDLLTNMLKVRKFPMSLSERISEKNVVDKVFESSFHNIAIHWLKRGYARVVGKPMPWGVYIRLYPILVLVATSLPSIVLSGVLLSKL